MKTTASRCCEFQAVPCEISAIKIPSFSFGNPIFNHVVECAERKILRVFFFSVHVSVAREITEWLFFKFPLKYTCYLVSFLTQELFLGCILTSADSREGPSKVAHQVCRISKTEILWSWFQILKGTAVWSKQGKIILCLKNMLKYSFIDTDPVFKVTCFKFTISFWDPTLH